MNTFTHLARRTDIMIRSLAVYPGDNESGATTTKEKMLWLVGLGIGIPAVVAAIISKVGNTGGI